MPDIAHTLVFEALTRAATNPDGLPLYTTRHMPGLFATSAAGKNAARRCKDEGLLNVLRTENKGKAQHEFCGITDKGLTLLLQHADPRPVLEAFARALETCRGELAQIHDDVRRSQHDLDALRTTALQVLERLAADQRAGPDHREPSGAAGPAIRAELTRWHEAGLLGDCPLPELWRRLRPRWAGLTIGQFHDQLRLLHQAEEIYLHPWTGPLYELPEPALALLVGHEIAYYASLRQPGDGRPGAFQEENP